MKHIVACLVLFMLSGCSFRYTFSGYFYVTMDNQGNYYCAINNDTQVSKTFRNIKAATKVCDDLNKALGPNANTFSNEGRPEIDNSGARGATGAAAASSM